jgi:hypothetical protein
MARSTKGSNQRPDTLMQDRTSANSMKVLLQRTAGPYIRVNRVGSILRPRSRHVCFAPKADKEASMALSPLCAISGCEQMQQVASLLDDLVGAGEKRWRHVEAEHIGGLEVDREPILRRRLYW